MTRVLRAGLTLLATLVAALSMTAGVSTASTFPQYDHVFLIVDENHNYNQIIGNSNAPQINALAGDYGSATRYTGVGDPSLPNYIAMLGGSTFGISDDDPYFFSGHTLNQPNLMSQLEDAGKSWKGYYQGMPYAGYRGYCYPAKCNGIPDADTQYVAKHNGVPYFQNMQTSAEFAKQNPLSQLSTDLTAGTVANFSYIIPDECNDMHGAPPWCVDSGKAGDVDDNWLVATGDKFVGTTVNQITSSSMWSTGNNAIVVTFDEGNKISSQIATIVITNHGPRGVTDNNPYNHYNLLASLQAAFGLGCLQNSCNTATMTPLFQITGSNTTPTLPGPFTPPPNGTNSVSTASQIARGIQTSPSCNAGWQVVPSPSVGNLDNDLAAVSAASTTDAWAVGAYYPSTTPTVLSTMAEHWDGTSWTEFQLPNVGLNENTLLGVSELSSGKAWAVGYYVNASWVQQSLIEHYDGRNWSVIPNPNPGVNGDILYGVAANADNDVWAVGTHKDANGVFHVLAEHWDGNSWTVSNAVDPNSGGNNFYAVKAVSANSVYALGQTGTGFPSQALVEHWDGHNWAQLNSPADATESLTTLGVTGNDSALTLVGDRENSTSPYTTEVATGAPNSLSLVTSPNNGAGENDLFATATAADGSAYAAGWYINASGTHQTLILHRVNGQWSLDTSPNLNTGDNGFAGLAQVPGGGQWAVGVSSGSGNFSTLIAYRC
jgi:Phosphoesterase family